MDHVLGVVFKLPSDNVLKRALDHSMYILPEDFITETDDTQDLRSSCHGGFSCGSDLDNLQFV